MSAKTVRDRVILREDILGDRDACFSTRSVTSSGTQVYCVYCHANNKSPVFINERIDEEDKEGTWFENNGKYSAIRGRYRDTLRPCNVDIVKMSSHDMLVITQHGISGLAVGMTLKGGLNLTWRRRTSHGNK